PLVCCIEPTDELVGTPSATIEVLRNVGGAGEVRRASDGRHSQLSTTFSECDRGNARGTDCAGSTPRAFLCRQPNPYATVSVGSVGLGWGTHSSPRRFEFRATAFVTTGRLDACGGCRRRPTIADAPLVCLQA